MLPVIKSRGAYKESACMGTKNEVPANDESTRILIVENDDDDVYLIKNLLGRDPTKQYEFEHCKRLDEGLSKASKLSFDVILLDLGLPDSEGIETLRSFSLAGLECPVIVLTGASDQTLGELSIKEGAEDYLPKKIVTTELLSRAIAYAIERYRLVVELRHRAEEDPLTGLPNRSMIYDKLEFMISQSERSNRQFSVVMLDLDKFKDINDTKGHRYGDQLLKTFSQRLKGIMRRSDYVSRYGGDEFFMIVSNYRDEKELTELMESKQRELSKPYTFSMDGKNHSQVVSVSIGVMTWEKGLSSGDMLERADQAMYRSKRKELGSLTFV